MSRTPPEGLSKVEFAMGVNARQYGGGPAELLKYQRLVNLTAEQQKNGGSLKTQGHLSSGSLACALGHYSIWQKAAQHPGWTVVLEDDASVRPGTDWNKIVNVATSNKKIGFVWLEGRPCGPGWGTAAYSLSQSFAKKLLKLYKFDKVVDGWLLEDVVPRHLPGVCPKASDMPFMHGKDFRDDGLHGGESEIRSD
mmetsp:Transcript_2/g.7  ORF Transcript_2/g.7 Transcript_2/m.7 type:complete len:195 (-) Transcript_2:451-1035(-)